VTAQTPIPGRTPTHPWRVRVLTLFPEMFPGPLGESLAGKPVRWVAVEDRQAICRSDADNGKVMGIFAPGYTMHQYREWLLTTVANILDDDLSISSAGLLRGGAVAWVEVSVPESITTPEGVTFEEEQGFRFVAMNPQCVSFYRIQTCRLLGIAADVDKITAVFLDRNNYRLLILAVQRRTVGPRQIHVDALGHHRRSDHEHHQQHQHHVDVRHNVDIGHQLARRTNLHGRHY